MKIHKSAIVHPDVVLGEEVEIGPFSIIGANVTIGEGTIIKNHVTITGNTSIGKTILSILMPFWAQNRKTLNIEGSVHFLKWVIIMLFGKA